MPRFIAAASPRRTDERPRRSARQQFAVLAIAITAALTTVIGHSIPAEAAEHPVSVATAVHAEAAAAAPTDADTASASAAGTSTTYTPSGAEAKDPHQIGASARSWGWNWHGGLWVDIPASAWPILVAFAGSGATSYFCRVPEIGPLLCAIGGAATAAVVEWVKHHPPCPNGGTFRFYTGDRESYCH